MAKKKEKALKKLAVLTSGGDSPGMNAAVYGFASSAKLGGFEVYGVIDGYKGFINQDFQILDVENLRKNVSSAGTCIGSSRCLEFKNPEVREQAVDKFKKAGFDGLFVVGGDGSYMGANFISELGCPVVSAPGTIDNDVSSSLYTIGFFSALEEIYQCVLKVRATSESHSQVTFVEVMGRHCHDLSVVSSVASAVDLVITNKSIKKVSEIIKIVKKLIKSGKRGIVILVTEKVFGEQFDFGLPSLSDVCSEIEKQVGRQVRNTVLGYIQRGAVPTAWDNYMAYGFGKRAFELISEGRFGFALGFDGVKYYETKLSDAVNMPKKMDNILIDHINSLYNL